MASGASGCSKPKRGGESGAALQLTKYGVAVALQYGFETPVYPVLVLFAPDRSPKNLEPEFSKSAGLVGIHVRFHVVRMWEVDARRVLDMGRPALLPWVPLLNGSRKELEEAAARIMETGNTRLASAFCTLGGLRYDKLTLERLLESMPMFIPQELIDEGPLYVEARARGKADGERSLIQYLLRERFPELLAESAVLDTVTHPDRLTAIFKEILSAQSTDQARAALRTR
jgi:hypothetical protein